MSSYFRYNTFSNGLNCLCFQGAINALQSLLSFEGNNIISFERLLFILGDKNNCPYLLKIAVFPYPGKLPFVLQIIFSSSSLTSARETSSNIDVHNLVHKGASLNISIRLTTFSSIISLLYSVSLKSLFDDTASCLSLSCSFFGSVKNFKLLNIFITKYRF